MTISPLQNSQVQDPNKSKFEKELFFPVLSSGKKNQIVLTRISIHFWYSQQFWGLDPVILVGELMSSLTEGK